MPSSDDGIVVTYYYNCYRQRKIKRMWCHHYIEKNIHCRLFVAAEELKKSDSKFIAFVLHDERIIPTLDRHCSSISTRECAGTSERIRPQNQC